MKDIADIKDQLREDQRKKNREEMPWVAKLMDEVNEKYPDSKLIWAHDLLTGKEIGKRPVEKNVFVIPDNYRQTEAINVRKGRGKTR
jgi:hypothetical protein